MAKVYDFANLPLSTLTRFSYVFVMLLIILAVSTNYFVLSSLKRHASTSSKISMKLFDNIEHARYLVVDNQRIALHSILQKDETLLFEVASQANAFYMIMNAVQTDLSTLEQDSERYHAPAIFDELKSDIKDIKLQYQQYLKNMLSKSAVLADAGVNDPEQTEYLRNYQRLFNKKINAMVEKIDALAKENVDIIKKDANTSIVVLSILSLALLAFTVWAMFVVNKFFIRPLRIATDFADKYDYESIEVDRRLAFASDNEIGKLSKNINKMLDKLNTVTVSKNKLETAIVELEAANKTKSDFLASMSHEFRTPLNAVIGFSDLMADNVSTDEHKEFMLGIKQAGHDLLTMVDNIIDASKYQAGQVDYHIQRIGLYGIIHDCILSVKPDSIRKSISVSLLEEQDEIYIYSDELVLKNAINNLLTNGIKYNSAGGKVNISVTHESDNKIKIQVADNGLGISDTNQSKLFEAFQRLDFANSNIRGTGIGLYITKKHIEGLGGRVGFSSRLTEGSRFWIELTKNTPCQKTERCIGNS